MKTPYSFYHNLFKEKSNEGGIKEHEQEVYENNDFNNIEVTTSIGDAQQMALSTTEIEEEDADTSNNPKECNCNIHDEENPTEVENEKELDKIPDLPVYISSSFPTYKGYGTGPPAGPKRYKNDDELHTPPRGRLLGEHDVFINKLYWFLRLVSTVMLGLSILVIVALGYVYGISLLQSEDSRLAMGTYGAFLFGHLIIQAFFAYLEHRKAANNIPPDDYEYTAPNSIALQISAYQEDPDYFRECIEGIMHLKYPKDKFKVLCFIDGNSQDSCYMVDIFEKVVKEYGEEPTFFWWDYNYHELPEGISNDENGVNSLVECIANNNFIVLMQKWGGKREVMYTAFKALQGMVDYVQVCDSDTKLDPMATIELAWVLDNDLTTGAVGGDVKILNEGDSFISFLSGLRYWMAFNVERACQSYFGCVSCISGPLGLYRMSVLEQFLDLWSDQKFLGEVCTFGDDRHLTNRMLQMGYKTKYTPRSICLTETPAEYLRWLSQQIRWTKSYFREWLFNSMWWHKQSLWCVYENVVAGGFPFYVMATCIVTFYSKDVWSIIFLLLTIQLVGIIKGIMAGLLRRDWRMIYMSLYSSLYITSLLPAKIFAILTIRKKGWGTSGRKTMLTTYNALIPPLCWLAVLLPGLFYTLERNDYTTINEWLYLGIGFASYVLYWAVFLTTYNTCVRPSLMKKSDLAEERDHQKQVLKGTDSKVSSNPQSFAHENDVIDENEVLIDRRRSLASFTHSTVFTVNSDPTFNSTKTKQSHEGLANTNGISFDEEGNVSLKSSEKESVEQVLEAEAVDLSNEEEQGEVCKDPKCTDDSHNHSHNRDHWLQKWIKWLHW